MRLGNVTPPDPVTGLPIETDPDNGSVPIYDPYQPLPEYDPPLVPGNGNTTSPGDGQHGGDDPYQLPEITGSTTPFPWPLVIFALIGLMGRATVRRRNF